jgi:DMSO reductase family type II enzyme molybdopterin subunit
VERRAVDAIRRRRGPVIDRRLSRRAFLRATGTVAASLTLARLELGCGERPAGDGIVTGEAASGVPSYRGWEDLYRRKWTWDRIARGTHTMTNCVSGCAWNLYMKEGIVWREEQAAPYVASAVGLPDFNPRGCQKGACGASLQYSPSRIRYPLRRVGTRGEGRWERITWDEALATVASAIVDALESRGPEALLCELGPNIGAGPNSAAPLRFFRLLGARATDSMAQVGDLSLGATITLGNGHPCGSSDDWWRSSLLVLWAFNPSATRIPDAHFLWEARYHGAEVVVVAPDLNASAIHADLWLNPRPGTDAALALAAAQVIVTEKLYDAPYVAEQTDLSLLVRTDTGRFLRAADLEEGGAETGFYVWDARRRAPAPAPGSGGSERLDVGALAIDLEFTGTVPIAGRPVPVRTVFSLLRETLEREHRPEQAAVVTGVPADVVRRFARRLAAAPAALILSSWGQCKFLHGDLAQRAQILLVALTGNLGRAGGGWRAGGFFAPEGFALLAVQERLGLLDLATFGARAYLDRASVERSFSDYLVPGAIWHAVHGGLAATSTEPRYGDTSVPRPTRDYLAEALDRKWFPVQAGEPPAVILSIFGNVLRHARNNRTLLATLWPQVGHVVDVNFRMSETGRHADVILPAAHWYEKCDLKYLASFIPYVHLGDRAAAPLGEAKPEWEIFALLAEAVAREARRRGLAPYTDVAGTERDARRLDEAFTDRGRFGPGDEEAALAFVLKWSSMTKGVDLDDLRARGGAVRFHDVGASGGTAGFYSDYHADEPLVPHQWFVKDKRRWPTLTGRQQFYVDHPWFLECGEALPTHKSPPAAGGDYPLVLTGGHTRWSIHSQWRDQRLLLHLQRGTPVVYVSEQDASARGIRDHELVRVRNDLGAVLMHAKIARYVQPGQLLVYHAWEPYQFPGGVSDHAIEPSPLKPTNLVGDYGHLQWAYAHWEPNQVDRDTRVEIERV